jgi:hypothetical protein
MAIQILDDFCDAKTAQGNANQTDTVHQKRQIHCETHLAAIHIGSHQPQQNANQGHRQSVEHASSSHKTYAEKPQ